MENGPEKATKTGVAQGSSSLSLISNIHLEWMATPQNTAGILEAMEESIRLV